MRVDQIVLDISLELSCIPCQYINGCDLRLLRVTPLDHEADHVLIVYLDNGCGIGILVLEDDGAGGIGIDSGIV